ncbi:MAG TPA: type II toxin-antitoxin system RelE/ParE family toxin [Verrucomicrobiae bacterium]|nr:type II toxin-antitoxin system RelE/ParE family toxin [Verrucomicrobiae bacterium]
MKRVWLKSPADLDFLQALEWYEERQPGLGRAFDTELRALFERIKQNPDLFQKETALVRKARMPRFKYRIYFTVEGDEIGVVAIYHPSRNPDTLRRRFQ